MQRGYGVGGLFRCVASGLLPLLPKTGKAIAYTSLAVASDKMRDVPLSEALKKRGLEAGKKLLYPPRNECICISDVFGSI